MLSDQIQQDNHLLTTCHYLARTHVVVRTYTVVVSLVIVGNRAHDSNIQPIANAVKVRQLMYPLLVRYNYMYMYMFNTIAVPTTCACSHASLVCVVCLSR